jgi:hypothetical protein
VVGHGEAWQGEVVSGLVGCGVVGRGVVWQGEAFQFIFETGCFGNELFGEVGRGGAG